MTSTDRTGLTVKQLMWCCARYEQACPYLEPNQGKCRDDSIGFICSECGGTSRVPLLPGVREPCPECEGTAKRQIEKDGPIYNCDVCYALGYTPTEDVWKWIEQCINLDYQFMVSGPTQFFESLNDILRPLAVNAADVQEWVEKEIL